MRNARVLATLALALVVGMLLSSSPVTAGTYDDPYFLGWSNFLPSTATDFAATTENDCPKGSTKCVDNVIREMTKRYNGLGCKHDSMFAFTYLVTTKEYRKAIEDPAFFTDNAFVNHQDANFADMYFNAFDAWAKGNVGAVPPAWRIAFDAADNQHVSGMGNVLLGMNAHVNRDLAFVLDAIGLVKPDGTSRKPDHDKVNAFLNAVNKYLLTEAAKYLDPTVDDGDFPGTSIDNSTAVQLLVSWREGAWRNAERLAAAGSAWERTAIAQEIEDNAAHIGTMLKSTFAYDGITTTPAARNAFCATAFRSL